MAVETVANVQGAYFFVTVWPIISIGTLMKVTGAKRDFWLVKTLGLILAVIGAALVIGALRGETGAGGAFLGIASAAGLAAVDISYTARRVIAPVYLADAFVELL